MVRERTVCEERLGFLSLKKRRHMEGSSCRQQYPVGGYRENGVTCLSKVCGETNYNSLALHKAAVKIFSIQCIMYCSCCPSFCRGNASIESFSTLLECLLLVTF